MSSPTEFDISGKTGEDLEKLLIDLVDNNEWKNRHTYLFYKSNPENICFKIESNSKSKQTGNGIVKDLNGEAWSWDELKNALKQNAQSIKGSQQAFLELHPSRDSSYQPDHLGLNSSTANITYSMDSMSLQSSSSETLYQFPDKRKHFLENFLSNINFKSEAAIANVLLLFEVARRRSDEDYPLSRRQTKKAIEEVMRSGARSAYKNKVIIYLLHKIHKVLKFHH